MINKKQLALFLTAILLLPLLISCSSTEDVGYSSKLSCKELCDGLIREISVPEGEFSSYSEEDVKLFFQMEEDGFEEIYIAHSSDSTDISELGVMLASDSQKASSLLEDARLYIKNSQEQKRDFVRNYSPSELEKLNSAEARRFGSYVVFVIAEPREKDAVFEKARELLS